MKIQEGIQRLVAIGGQISERLAGKSTLGRVAAVGVGLSAIAGAALLFARKGNLRARIDELGALLKPNDEVAVDAADSEKPERLNSHARRQRVPMPEPAAI